MSDAESTDRPRPVHPRCSAADGPQAPGYPDRSADELVLHCPWCRGRNSLSLPDTVRTPQGDECSIANGFCMNCGVGFCVARPDETMVHKVQDIQYSVTSG